MEEIMLDRYKRRLEPSKNITLGNIKIGLVVSY